MANTDLQYLYKMREYLEQEEYIKEYNSLIDQKMNIAFEQSCQKAKENVTQAEQNISQKTNHIKANIKADISEWRIKTFIVSLLITIIAPIFLAILFSPDLPKTLMYIFVTFLWGTCICIVNHDKFSENQMTTIIILMIVCLIGAIISASAYGVSGFWQWLLAIILVTLWPIVNFFFLKPLIWLSILTIILTFFTSLLAYFIDAEDTENEDVSNHNDIIEAKAQYEQACEVYQITRKRNYPILQAEFQKRKKNPNVYANEKKAMQSIIPANLQNLDLINKLIWCIEQRYANDIVSARNWYLQQAYNQAMLKKLDIVADECRAIRQIAARAAADAAAAHKAVLTALNENTNAINKQSDAMNKEFGKLNKTAERGVKAAERGANAAEKGARAAEEGATYSRRNWLDS